MSSLTDGGTPFIGPLPLPVTSLDGGSTPAPTVHQSPETNVARQGLKPLKKDLQRSGSDLSNFSPRITRKGKPKPLEPKDVKAASSYEKAVAEPAKKKAAKKAAAKSLTVQEVQQQSTDRVDLLARSEGVKSEEVEDPTVPLTVSSKLFVTQEEEEAQFKKSEIAHLVGQSASEDGSVSVPSVFTSFANGGKIDAEPWSISLDPETKKAVITRGRVVPTAVRETAKGNHLMNCYVTVQDGMAVVRISVVDTKEKVLEYKAVILEAHRLLKQELGREVPFRVVSEQLNSQESEDGLISNQHGWLAFLNKELKKEGVNGKIIHINTPSSRYYNVTKFIRKIPILGWILEKTYFKGEAKSKELNLEGWGNYVGWLQQDLQGLRMQEGKTKGLSHLEGAIETFQQLGTITEEMNEAYAALIEIKDLDKKIELIDQQISKVKDPHIQRTLKQKKDQLKVERANIRPLRAACEQIIKQGKQKLVLLLCESRKKLIRLQNMLSSVLQRDLTPGLKGSIVAFEEKAGLMIDILGSQLEIPGVAPMSRGREISLIQRLNDKMEVVSTLNCKSGLDRTGFAWAVRMASVQMRKLFERGDVVKGDGIVANMHKHWDSTTKELNKRMSTMKPQDFDAWLKADSVSSKETLLKARLREVIQYRKCVLNNLLKICLPITAKSTGVIGLKWKTFMENRLPLNFIPTYVQDEQGKLIKLVNCTKAGKVTGLTEEGKQLLLQLSSRRGA